MLDQAQETEAMFLDRALAAQARRTPRGASAVNCLDCGDEIPAERRRAAPGCRRCVDCQGFHERTHGR